MHGTLENWDLKQKIIQEVEQRSDETLLKRILNVACIGKYNSWTWEKFHQRLIENDINNFNNSQELHDYIQQKGSDARQFLNLRISNPNA